MSDEALLHAERAWRESGSSLDFAALLRERLRAGRLIAARVELAAYAGDEAARLVVGTPPANSDIKAWSEGLDRFGRDVVVRAAHAAAASVVELWNGRPDPSVQHLGGAAPSVRLAAAERWLACPCERHAREARDTFNDVVGSDAVQNFGTHPWTLAHDSADGVVWSLGTGETETTLGFLGDSVHLAAMARGFSQLRVEDVPHITRENRHELEALWERALNAGQPLIRDAIRAGIAPWALA